MRRLLHILLAGMFLMAITGCGSDNSVQIPKNPEPPPAKGSLKSISGEPVTPGQPVKKTMQ
ncbi:MAG: hypothetical protein JW818_18370 [Pirellulales bacterium]|nr:hypothetical protein [Pirellulales bacterium]